jgi:hypothetical protein
VQVGGYGDVDVGQLGCAFSGRARRGYRAPAVIVPLEQRDRGGAERLPHLLQQQGQRFGFGHEHGRELREQGRFRSGAHGLLPTSHRVVHHQRH